MAYGNGEGRKRTGDTTIFRTPRGFVSFREAMGYQRCGGYPMADAVATSHARYALLGREWSAA